MTPADTADTGSVGMALDCSGCADGCPTVDVGDMSKARCWKGEGEEEEAAGDEEVETPLPNLMELCFYFEQASISLNREEMIRVWLALKNLVDNHPLQHVRFWGKLLGTEQNYYVAEVEYREGDEEEEEEEEVRDAGKVIQYNFFWTTTPLPEEAAEEDVAEKEEGEEEEGEEQEEDDTPKPEFKPPPVTPKEDNRTGANKKVYFVCNDLQKNEDDFDDDDEEEEREEPDEPEPEVGPPLLTPLAEDEEVNNMPPWTAQMSSNLIPQYAIAVMHSNLWPGAHAFGFEKKFENVYVGSGHKYSMENYTPPAPPPIMEEFPSGPEITEAEDPSPEEEAALRAAQQEAAEAAEEMEDAEEEDEEDD
nr:hypothetical protein BaRGS_031803 [Batillaria attramentaria]